MPAAFRHSPEAELQLQLVPHVDLERLRTGAADDMAWTTLATRINWGSVLAHEYHPEAIETMEAAARALASVHQRHARLGTWGASGPEFTALGDALVVVDEMQQAHTKRELHAALQTVMRAQKIPARSGELLEVDA
ncbi:MAG TPA: hypothetical protein VEA81_00295 [Burkholderiaceae bacterium]|nr:hypothetical protein [Burkholderiaceae bacterium]